MACEITPVVPSGNLYAKFPSKPSWADSRQVVITFKGQDLTGNNTLNVGTVKPKSIGAVVTGADFKTVPSASLLNSF